MTERQKPTLKKVRVIGFQVLPSLVVDDGETLEVIEAQPLAVTASQWPSFAAEGWPRALADLEAKLNAPDPG